MLYNIMVLHKLMILAILLALTSCTATRNAGQDYKDEPASSVPDHAPVGSMENPAREAGDVSEADDAEARKAYGQEILSRIKPGPDNNGYSYTICKYKNRYQVPGLVVFLFYQNTQYMLGVFQDDLSPSNLVEFEETKKGIVLYKPWGDDKTRQFVRDFMKENLPALKAAKTPMKGEFDWQDLDFSKAITCKVPAKYM